MNDIDAEMLIAEVQKRPILWDRTCKRYHNKVRVGREWIKVAVIVHEQVDKVKAKWKNLRDQFRKELKKVPNCKDLEEGPLMYTGTWPYFKALEFLRDVIVTRKGFLATPALGEEIPDDLSNDSVEIKFDISSTENYQEDEYMRTHTTPASDTTDLNTVENQQRSNRNMKRPAPDPLSFEMRFKEEPLDFQPKKMAHSESEDDDLYFFQSLLPFFKQFDALTKLQLRQQIQGLILEKFTNLHHTSAISSISVSAPVSLPPTDLSEPYQIANHNYTNFSVSENEQKQVYR